MSASTRAFWLRHRVTFAVVLLLLTMIAEAGLSTRQESPSWDEGDHIYSGYMNWKHGEYSLNPEHPPLVKLIATLPLLPLQLKIAPRQGRFFKSEAYYGGRELLFRNDPKYGGLYSADTLLFRIHMAVLVFGLTLALLLFLAAREMFGTAAGLAAMALFVFDPTVLTNATFVTTDTGAACGFFATIYTFYRFLERPRWGRATVCGVVLGLALCTKHSMVAVVPMLLVLVAADLAVRRGSRYRHTNLKQRWSRQSSDIHLQIGKLAGGLLTIAALAVVVLWGVYSFRYAMHPQGVEMPPLAQQMTSLPPFSRASISFCARHHLLPESYLYGLVDVQRVGIYMPTYIFGKLYAHGQWFYFPALLSLKWSIGVLGLLCLTAYLLLAGKLDRPRELFFLAFPLFAYLATAMASPLNIGVRHVLPVFPFAFALAGAGAAVLWRQHRRWRYVIAALLLWHAIDSIRMFPNYMPYANALWGGPSRTHLYFSDSATEWGQELKWTKRWLDDRNIHNCWFAYFPAPFLLPSDYGIPCKLLPTLDTVYEQNITVPAVVHGPILISFADLNGFEFGTSVRNPYQRLFQRKPDDVIANGVAVYYGDSNLPEAAALQYIQTSRDRLKASPQEALRAAREAIALVPYSFDGNLTLGDALAATGEKAAARQAFAVALGRIPAMEPSAQEHWKPIVAKRLAELR